MFKETNLRLPRYIVDPDRTMYKLERTKRNKDGSAYKSTHFFKARNDRNAKFLVSKRLKIERNEIWWLYNEWDELVGVKTDYLGWKI